MRKNRENKSWWQRIILITTLVIFFNHLPLAWADEITVINTQPTTLITPIGNQNYTSKLTQSCKGINHLQTKRKIVALTFDDGPHKIYTKQVLQILKKHNIKATFFLIGVNIDGNENIVRKMAEEGHVVANHSYAHYHLPTMSADEIKRSLITTSKSIANIIGEYPILFRPPYGACSRQSVKTIKDLGYKTIMWNDMVDDYNPNTTTQKITMGIINLAKPGAIIGMHDGGGNREKTVATLPIIIKTLKSQGYEFLTIPELLGIDPYHTIEEENEV